MKKTFTQNFSNEQKEVIAVFFALLKFIKNNKEEYIKLLLNYLEIDDINSIDIDYKNPENTREILSLFILKSANFSYRNLIDYLDLFSKKLKEFKTLPINQKKFTSFFNFIFPKKTDTNPHRKIEAWFQAAEQDFLNYSNLKIPGNQNKFLQEISPLILNQYKRMIDEFSWLLKLNKQQKKRLTKRKQVDIMIIVFILIAAFIFLFARRLLLAAHKKLSKNNEFFTENSVNIIAAIIGLFTAYFLKNSIYLETALGVYFSRVNKQLQQAVDDYLKDLKIETLNLPDSISLNIVFPDSIKVDIFNEKKSITSIKLSKAEEEEHLSKLLSTQSTMSAKSKKISKKSKEFIQTENSRYKFFLGKKIENNKSDNLESIDWQIGDKIFRADSNFIKPVRKGQNQYICLPETIATQLRENYPEQFDSLLRLIQDIPFAAKENENGLHKTECIEITLINSYQQNSKEPTKLKSDINIKYIANNFIARMWCIMHPSKNGKGSLYIPIVIEQHILSSTKAYKIDITNYSTLVDLTKSSFQPTSSPFRL